MNSLQVSGRASGNGTSRFSRGRVLTRISTRFFETESVAAITMMMLRYRVEVKEEPEFVSETFEERFARVTAFDERLTTA